MRTLWHDIWGSSRGIILHFVPQTRILCSGILFSACMIAPTDSIAGIMLITAILSCWAALCNPPFRLIRYFLIFGILMFLPYFLLLPLIRFENSNMSWAEALNVSWSIFVRGISGLLLSSVAVTSLTASDLRKGILSLPVPAMISMILLQIIHQTFEMVYEIQRITAAIKVRRAGGKGLSNLRMLFAFPRVWLVRIILHAERIADAMEIRGYCDGDLATLGKEPIVIKDIAVLIFVSLFLLTSIMMHWQVIA